MDDPTVPADVGTGKRTLMPTYDILTETVDQLEDELSALLDVSDEDLAATRQRYKDLKESRSRYEAAVSKLQAHLQRVGSVEELEELQRRRRHLSGDCGRVILKLNKLLRQEGVEVTLMHSASVNQLEVSKTQEETEALTQEMENRVEKEGPVTEELDGQAPFVNQIVEPRPPSPIMAIGPPRYASSRVDENESVRESPDATSHLENPALRHSRETRQSQTQLSDELQHMTLAGNIMLNDLLKEPKEPFSGVAGTFNAWASILKSRIEKVQGISEMDHLQILMCHTTGVPKKVVSDYYETVTSDTAAVIVETVWDVLRQRYGNTSANLTRLDQRVANFPKIASAEEGDKFYDLYDLCRHISSLMKTHRQLEKYNYSCLPELTRKLPYNIFSRWRSQATRTKMQSGEEPNLDTFIAFLKSLTHELNDPTLQYESESKAPDSKVKTRSSARSLSTGVTDTSDASPATGAAVTCQVHNSSKHHTKDCQIFKTWDYEKKSAYVKEHNLCFRCLSGDHRIFRCPHRKPPTCTTCKGRHLTVMHDPSRSRPSSESSSSTTTARTDVPDTVVSSRTHPLEQTEDLAVFSKTFEVELRDRTTKKSLRCLAIVDEQSTFCFADPEVMVLPVKSAPHTYNLRTLSGLSTQVSGFRLNGLEVRGAKEKKWFAMPTVLTNECIPDTRKEMATTEIVRSIKHIAHLAKHFVDRNEELRPLLLIGLTMGKMMWSKVIGRRTPYVHKTKLGYAVVGSVPRSTLPSHVRSEEPKSLLVMRSAAVEAGHDSFSATPVSGLPTSHVAFRPTTDVFETREDDDERAWSREEQLFMDKMKENVTLSDEGRIVLPLPFRSEAPKMPCNRGAVRHRTKTALDRLKRNPEVLDKCVKSVAEGLSNGYIEELSSEQEIPDDQNRVG